MAARDYFSQHPLGGGEVAQDLERAYLQQVEDEATGQDRTVLVLEILFTKGHHHVANILLQRLISVAPGGVADDSRSLTAQGKGPLYHE